MTEQKISLNNVINFIKYIGPKINVDLMGLIVDFDKSTNGTLLINYEDKYIAQNISFCVSKDSFKMFTDEKEDEFSNEWEKYISESYYTDMQLYFQHGGSRFG